MKAIATALMLAALVAAPAAAVEVALGLLGGEAYPAGGTGTYTPNTFFASRMPAANLGKGGVFGGKAVLYITPALGVEVAAVKYPHFPVQGYKTTGFEENPSGSATPVTVGPMYKWTWHGCGVYAVAGLGYFAVRHTLTGGSFSMYNT